MFGIRVPNLGFIPASHAFSRRVADLCGFAGTAAVELHQDGIINIPLRGRVDGVQIEAEATSQ
jgi:hypothetical protein